MPPPPNHPYLIEIGIGNPKLRIFSLDINSYFHWIVYMESRGNFEEVKRKRHLIFVRNKCFILNIQLFVFDLRKKRSVPYFAF